MLYLDLGRGVDRCRGFVDHLAIDFHFPGADQPLRFLTGRTKIPVYQDGVESLLGQRYPAMRPPFDSKKLPGFRQVERRETI
jgi:hypothetical protein